MSSCRYLRRRRDQKGPSFTYEVIIVDDGSRDATVRVAFDYVRAQGIDSMRVLQLPRNYGKVRPGAPAGLSGLVAVQDLPWKEPEALLEGFVTLVDFAQQYVCSSICTRNVCQSSCMWLYT